MNIFTAYANGLEYPHFEFVQNPDSPHNWVMTGNAGMVGDDGEYGSPIVLEITPEEFMNSYFGENWQGPK